MNWRLLQLADSGFPAGGFVHSAGLEAALQLGELGAARDFVVEVVYQTAQGALPFVRRGHAAAVDESALVEVDGAAEAFLLGAVANRASRAQGRAFAAAAAHAFAVVQPLGEVVRLGRLRGHLAPLQGAVAARLGLPVEDALRLALHMAARGVLSAAVRLGVVGPLEAQALHAELPLDEALASVPDQPAQSAPLLELFGSLHDRLYSRLFQS